MIFCAKKCAISGLCTSAHLHRQVEGHRRKPNQVHRPAIVIFACLLPPSLFEATADKSFTLRNDG
jgi:hypothetical protein